MARAPDSKSGCWGFESLLACQNIKEIRFTISCCGIQVFRGLQLADIREGLGNLVQYFQDSKVEMKKVTWPSRKETLGLTWVVLIFVVIISLFLGVSDLGLSKLVKLVLGA